MTHTIPDTRTIRAAALEQARDHRDEIVRKLATRSEIPDGEFVNVYFNFNQVCETIGQLQYALDYGWDQE